MDDSPGAERIPPTKKLFTRTDWKIVDTVCVFSWRFKEMMGEVLPAKAYSSTVVDELTAPFRLPIYIKRAGSYRVRNKKIAQNATLLSIYPSFLGRASPLKGVRNKFTYVKDSCFFFSLFLCCSISFSYFKMSGLLISHAHALLLSSSSV